MIRRRKLYTFPRALFWIVRNEKICFIGSLSKGRDIILSVMVADAACPRTPSVCILSILKIHRSQTVSKGVVRITCKFPVRQIL